MINKLTQARKIEIWKEIIATANNEDPEYSYRLFSETLDNASFSQKTTEVKEE